MKLPLRHIVRLNLPVMRKKKIPCRAPQSKMNSSDKISLSSTYISDIVDSQGSILTAYNQILPFSLRFGANSTWHAKLTDIRVKQGRVREALYNSMSRIATHTKF